MPVVDRPAAVGTAGIEYRVPVASVTRDLQCEIKQRKFCGVLLDQQGGSSDIAAKVQDNIGGAEFIDRGVPLVREPAQGDLDAV